MLDCLVYPVGEETYSRQTHYECHGRQSFPPAGVSKLEMMLVVHGTENKLADYPEDIDCCYDDRRCGGDYENTVEHVIVFERTEENRHLGYETGHTRQTE